MLSIIIPTLNEEKYLPFLLKSIKSQSLKDFEIIVADAGSQDKTIRISKSFDCKVVKGGLPSKGRNQGARIAKENIFLFSDADNIFLSQNFLKVLLKEFEKRNLDVASFSVYPKGNSFDRAAYNLYNFWANLTQRFLPHATTAVLVKRKIHEKIKGFDERIKMGEDHDYVRRAAKIGKFGFIRLGSVLTSARRFEKDGRINTYLKYVLWEFFSIIFGSLKSDVFDYKFDHYND